MNTNHENAYVIGENQVWFKIVNGETIYSFKDLCDLFNVIPKERTRLGRKVKSYSTKITITENGKDMTYSFVNKNGILLMLSCISFIKRNIYFIKLYKFITGKSLLKDLLKFKIDKSFNIYKSDKILNNLKK